MRGGRTTMIFIFFSCFCRGRNAPFSVLLFICEGGRGSPPQGSERRAERLAPRAAGSSRAGPPPKTRARRRSSERRNYGYSISYRHLLPVTGYAARAGKVKTGRDENRPRSISLRGRFYLAYSVNPRSRLCARRSGRSLRAGTSVCGRRYTDRSVPARRWSAACSRSRGSWDCRAGRRSTLSGGR